MEDIPFAFEDLHVRKELEHRIVVETAEGRRGVADDDVRLRRWELRGGARAQHVLVEAQAAERASSGDGEDRFDEVLGRRDDAVDLPFDAAVDEAVGFADFAGEDDGGGVFFVSCLSAESGVILRGFVAARAIDNFGRYC